MYNTSCSLGSGAQCVFHGDKVREDVAEGTAGHCLTGITAAAITFSLSNHGNSSQFEPALNYVLY